MFAELTRDRAASFRVGELKKNARRKFFWGVGEGACGFLFTFSKVTENAIITIKLFTITAEIHAYSLVNFYCQHADRHMNLKFMRRVSERERAIRQFVIVKNKLMSVFNASLLLLIMNFMISFHIFTKLKYHRLLCYSTDINL